jgi:hypothetical protein
VAQHAPVATAPIRALNYLTRPPRTGMMERTEQSAIFLALKYSATTSRKNLTLREAIGWNFV